ncbi:hypothetical protein HOG27_04205, partial [bacterium]|nr:hypothetical protein [bacterium]
NIFTTVGVHVISLVAGLNDKPVGNHVTVYVRVSHSVSVNSAKVIVVIATFSSHV